MLRNDVPDLVAWLLELVGTVLVSFGSMKTGRHCSKDPVSIIPAGLYGILVY
jgi:hypothetical protein